LKKINLLYWLVLPALCYLCYYIISGFSNKVTDFLGYTENKETELNLDYGAVVEKIYVIQGQKVKKGDLLLEMNKSSFDKEIQNYDQSVAILDNKNKIDYAEIITSIEKIKADKTQRIIQLNNEIANEESKLEYNKSLLSSSVKNLEGTKIIHPIEEKIASLRKEINTVETSSSNILQSYNVLLKKMQSTQVEAKTFITNRDYIIQEKNKLKIVAPFDGLIGSINVKNAEFVQAYSSLISFYEPSPINVVGYVHESLSLRINVGDSVIVKSIMHPKNITKGVVTGTGFRIIEIPERLRKIPEYKTYGIEVFISIPSNGKFLQKETVRLSAIGKSNSLF
jgi:multidrug resistance efflux pump